MITTLVRIYYYCIVTFCVFFIFSRYLCSYEIITDIIKDNIYEIDLEIIIVIIIPYIYIYIYIYIYTV